MSEPICLYQSDDQWRRNKLGHGPSTYGRGGCLLCCLTMAARILETRPGALPPTVNQALLDVEAYLGDLIIIERAARALGLSAPSAELVRAMPGNEVEPLAAAIRDSLEAGGLAILHIDHDSDKPGGDPSGDHFGLAHKMTTGQGARVFMLDPAVGRVTLYPSTLESVGEVVWGKDDRRRYHVKAVRPIRRLEQ